MHGKLSTATVSVFLVLTGQAQSPLPGPDLTRGESAAVAAVAAASPEQVLHQQVDADEAWAAGSTWKASFTTIGCTFYPSFGAGAPRHFPVHFAVRRVTVGGSDLPLRTTAGPRRTGDRIVFDRGAVVERYDLTPTHVEQSFVVDARGAGDVVLDLAIDTELRADTARPGIRFGNEFGVVNYGEAFLVRGGQRLPIVSTWDGGNLRFVVPASQRGDGPVVIDPIIGTSTPSGGNPQRPVNSPTAAFAAGSATWLLAWESIPVTADRDVYCQLFDRNGVPVAGSTSAIDITTNNYSAPSVGTLAGEDRFLIAYGAAKPGVHQGMSHIYGRLRGATAAAALTVEFLISDPQQPGNHYGPQVGGDSGMAPTPTGWIVAWTQTVAYQQGAVRWRVCSPYGVLLGQEGSVPSSTAVPVRPAVSKSNGRGRVSRPGWLLCYELYDANIPDSDLLAAWLDLNGLPQHHIPIAVGPDRDATPSVSSAAPTPDGASTRFVVLNGHGATLSARATVVTMSPGPSVAPAVDLTSAFGFRTANLAVETDGARHVVQAGLPGSPQMGLATLAFDASGAATVQAPIFPVPGNATGAELLSEYAGGGGATNFASVYGDSNGAGYSSWVLFTLYQGYAPGAQVLQHATACDGLTGQWSGPPILGQSMQFTLGNYGAATPGFVFGEPDLFGPTLCPSCTFGLRLDRPLVPRLGADTCTLAIPPVPDLVGQTFAVQGVGIGGGSCLGTLSFGDLIEFTVR